MIHTKRMPLLPVVLLVPAVLLIAACQTMNTGGSPTGPSVSVRDQSVAGGTVTVARVVSQGPGWLMIHAQANGGPGPILGNARVSDGVNRNVKVEIDLSRATPVLYAMLHTDAGQVGVMEFPGPDAPVVVAGKVVTPSFTATASNPSMSGSSSGSSGGY